MNDFDRIMLTSKRDIKKFYKEARADDLLEEFDKYERQKRPYVLFLLKPDDKLPQAAVDYAIQMYGYLTVVKSINIEKHIFDRILSLGQQYKPGEDHFK